MGEVYIKKAMGGMSAVKMTYIVLLVVIVPTLVYLYRTYTYSGEYLVPAAYDYPQASAPSCTTLPGGVADHEPVESDAGIPFNVTTPSNYRVDIRHPLLVVWAPSGFNQSLSERFTGLTQLATARGFVVVHVGSVPLGLKALEAMAGVPELVARRWCINHQAVFYTGHSDGGTVSNALAVMPDLPTPPAAIAPSAMGMRKVDMDKYACPRPLPVMLMHNRGDHHFRDYGAGVAQWWAECNQCSTQTRPSQFNGCVEYMGCAEGAPTLFCQAEGNHAHWPGSEHDPVKFFREVVDNL